MLALSVGAFAIPAVLIVRIKPPKGIAPMDTPIADLLANEFEIDGRVVPIVWGISDPIYRAAIEEHKIRSGDDMPTLNEAFDVARKLKAEYVLATDMRSGSDKIYAAAALYRNGRVIWKDPSNDVGAIIAHWKTMLRKKQITQDAFDQQVLEATYRSSAVQIGSKFGQDDTLRSFARTWVAMLNSGPFLSLPKAPTRPTPQPGAGQTPKNPGTGTTPPVKPVDDSKWKADAEAAIKGGDTSKAISILREAIDSAPMDVARRVFLIKTLTQMGQPDVAAREARRAADLMPDHIEFRALAATAWIQAGNIDEAQSDLNEAISRAPDSPETRLLLANVAIAKGDFSAAIGHLDKALAANPTGDAYYLRALAKAMSGDSDQADADVKKAIEAGLSQDPQEAEARYRLVASIFDGGLTLIGGDIRTLHSRAQVDRTDKDVKSTFDDLRKRVAGRSRFISALPVPAGHELSHNRRVLAYKLLSQCLTDLESYLKSGDVDVLTDSRINLGEALKQGVSAREEFKNEQQRTKKSDGKPG